MDTILAKNKKYCTLCHDYVICEEDICPEDGETCSEECCHAEDYDLDNMSRDELVEYLAATGEEYTEDDIDFIFDAMSEGASLDGAIINLEYNKEG